MAVKRMQVFILAMLLLFCGCSQSNDKYTYVFWQPDDQIVSIEILRKTTDTASIDDPTEVICVVSTEEYTDFLRKLKTVPGEHQAVDPLTGLGPYIIRITYKDGEIVLIGYANTVYEQPGGKRRYYYFTFDFDAFHDFISQVLDIDVSTDLIQ